MKVYERGAVGLNLGRLLEERSPISDPILAVFFWMKRCWKTLQQHQFHVPGCLAGPVG